MNLIFPQLYNQGRKAFVRLLMASCCLLVTVQASAQDDEDDDAGREFIYGVNLNSNAGIIGGVIFRYSKPLTERTYHHFGLEIVNVKHPKEFRQPTQGNSFIYGKTNYLFAVRPHYGREVVLFRKSPEEGVRINALAAVGPSIGVIKPYFIELAVSNTETIIVQYDPEDPSHMDASRILGSAGLLRFNGSSIAAGLHAKVGFTFEFGNFRSSVTGFEVGTLTEVYSREIMIVKYLSVQNRQLFTSVYLNLFFGGRK